MKPLLTTALLALAPLAAQAEEHIFRCYFDWVCDPNTKCNHAGEDIRFKINIETNAVSRIAGNPLSDFDLIIGDRAITVLERPISGGTTTTTILTDNGDAVHSENAVDGRSLVPRQYLGNCILS
ncbi:hypothetical protein [Shimia abyssi]|uniref:Uncharacterized protein n=1 Tax=Shimia abyssi TaxID=1662395 RepID=A0A2P8FCI8_9RHOB|nr:hypothetical protein [Shimia abyssi]PSL19425.1 hypothetical protein CLV88_106138 [Shimia abyssi]